MALKAAIKTYGDDFANLVDGISVGSEDLYRNSPMGIAAGSYVGADPDTLVRYIKETKEAIAGTGLEKAPIGHVDTWTAWVNGTNQGVIDSIDWLGMDAYPYFQDTLPNDITKSNSLFQEALGNTEGAAGGKKVWITETGHPVSGKTVGESVASTENAETFWRDVVCPLLDSGANLWYYTLMDAAPDTPSPSFGITGNKLTTTPLFDLSCDGTKAESSSSASAGASSTAKGGASSSASSSGSKSTSVGNSGGSPGGVPSAQISSQESATVTPTGYTATATGSGSGSTVGSGSGSGTNGTFTAPPAATSTIPASGASGVNSGAFAAAFGAIMAAIYAL